MKYMLLAWTILGGNALLPENVLEKSWGKVEIRRYFWFDLY